MIPLRDWSLGAKLALGTGVTAAVGGGAYLAARYLPSKGYRGWKLAGAVATPAAVTAASLYALTRQTQLLPGGVALALYPADTASEALPGDTLSRIAWALPQVVMPHAAPGGLVRGVPEIVRRVRALQGLSTVRVWLGVGSDGLTRSLGTSPTRDTLNAVLRQLADLAAMAVDVGAEAVVWDQEAAAKQYPEAGRLYARAAREVFALRAPKVLQGHTAYDQPGQHADYDWSAWLGTEAPQVRFDLPEVYVAPEDGTTAPAGALGRRLGRYQASWAAAVRAGWIRPDVVQWPYFQAHGVRTEDTLTVASAYHLCALWNAPGGIDDAGWLSCACLSALYRAGFVGPTALASYQRAKGLPVTGTGTLAVQSALVAGTTPRGLAVGG